MTTTLTESSTGLIPCLVCETQNEPDALICSACFAPMALIHEAVAQDRDPCIVTVIGDSNVGKTVYLGMLLDMLSKRADGFDAVPKGAYSVNLQHTVISYLSARRFPPKTAMEVDQWHWAYYQVCGKQDKKRIYDLVMPDMAGEAIAAEVATPRTFNVIRSLLEKSAGAILMVDAALAGAGSPQPDFFALKLMSYLDGVLASRKQDKLSTPVAVVLSKADYCPECFDDPRRSPRPISTGCGTSARIDSSTSSSSRPVSWERWDMALMSTATSYRSRCTSHRAACWSHSTGCCPS